MIFIDRVNDVHLMVECEIHVARELSTFFEFEVPGAKFMPAFRNRMWDGKIRLFSIKTNKIYAGLLSYLEDFLKKNNLEYVLHEGVTENVKSINVEDVQGFISSLNIPFETRDYQFNSICTAIENSKMMNKKILILVPTTSLVEQMSSDFVSYGWKEEHIHKIYSGHDKESDKPVTISTWQSLYKLQKKYFSQYQCIFGDEAHTFKAKSLTSIMEKLEDCPYRFGFTGTLDGTQTHRLVLEGLFGEVEKVITTKELIDKKTLAELTTNCVVLKHKEEECKQIKDYTYAEEISYLAGHIRRNNFITNLCKTLPGNTLCLFQLVEKHGNILYDMLKGDNTYYVYGGTSAEEREKIRENVNSSDNSIIVASYGTFSTGINIPNLNNIVFASPSKSRIRVLQSIGRGLRRNGTKNSVLIYDICDDLTYKSKKNFTLRHFEERINIYNEESFSYRIDEVKI